MNIKDKVTFVPVEVIFLELGLIIYTTHSTFFSVVSQYLSEAFLPSFDTYQDGISCPVKILVPLY